MDAPVQDTLITDATGLREICDRLRANGVAAVDTEFERVRTYHAQLALLQLGLDESHCWLIDPLEISDWTPLAELLADAGTVKLLHSCEEDIELLARITDCEPCSVFDTQVAAAFAGVGFSLGYSRLVSTVLDVQLEKGEQRSDWMQRPLSTAQLHYARADVAFLPALYEHLGNLLAARGFGDWCQAECDEVVRRRLRETPLFEAGRFRHARQLTRRQLAAVQLIGEWRERTAIERDLPRNWVMRDDDLLAIVTSNPASVAELRQVQGLQRASRERNGEKILALLREAEQVPDAECPELQDLPPTAQTRKLVQQLMDVVRARAKELDLPPELLAPRRRVQALVNAGYPDGPWELPASLRGWRAEAVGERLLATLREATEPAA